VLEALRTGDGQRLTAPYGHPASRRETKARGRTARLDLAASVTVAVLLASPASAIARVKTSFKLYVHVAGCYLQTGVIILPDLTDRHPFNRVQIAVDGFGKGRFLRTLPLGTTHGYTFGPLYSGRYRVQAYYPGDRARSAAGPRSMTVQMPQMCHVSDQPGQSRTPVETVGSSDHSTDAEFCATHQCIGAFTTEPGTIVQCSDGTYSHSGGISGACSRHGGEA
jgi:hypothetical protein